MEAPPRGWLCVLLLLGGGGAGCLEVLVVLGDELTAIAEFAREGVAVGDNLSDGEGTHRNVEVAAADGHRGVVHADVLVVDEVRRLELRLDDGAENDAGVRVEK